MWRSSHWPAACSACSNFSEPTPAPGADSKPIFHFSKVFAKSSIKFRAVTGILGRLVLIESLLLLVPLFVALIYGEADWWHFLVASMLAAACGGLAELAVGSSRTTIHAREGFIITSLVWIIFSLFGMLPFMLSDHPLSLTDAAFEVISGFTTTGASVIPDVEALSHGLLFWRAFIQWIGGLGIIFLMLAVLPELNKAVGISMFNAEATGITHDKLHPRIRSTAVSVWGVYCSLTLISVLLMWASPMNLFDAVCQTFTTVATGGFSTRNAGMLAWHSDYLLVVTTVMMYLGGVSVMLLYTGFRTGPRVVFRNRVLRVYTLIIAGAYLCMMAYGFFSGAERTWHRLLLYPMFYVISAITSTGFGVEGTGSWGPFCLLVTLMLMLIGSCAGSTAGGIKVDRIMVVFRHFFNELHRTVFQKRTYVVRLNGSQLTGDLSGRVGAFVTIYLLIAVLVTAYATILGYPLTDAFYLSASCIGCNGLGWGATGSGFGALPDSLKWVCSFEMLIGRLELFACLVLLLPSFWKR